MKKSNLKLRLRTSYCSFNIQEFLVTCQEAVLSFLYFVTNTTRELRDRNAYERPVIRTAYCKRRIVFNGISTSNGLPCSVKHSSFLHHIKKAIAKYCQIC